MTPLSFERNGQRISILNPLDELPPPPPSSTSEYFGSDEGSIRSLTEAPSTIRDTLSPAPKNGSPSQGSTRKLHQCGVCLKCFTTSGHLTRHARIHSGVKPHVCPYPGCDKDCSRLDNLIQHYRVHLPKEDRGRGNPYIRACMLDLPVPVVVPPSQQGTVTIERSTPAGSPSRPIKTEQKPVKPEHLPISMNAPLQSSVRRMSFAREERLPAPLSPIDSRLPQLVSPTESTISTAPSSALVTPPDEEDAKLLASLWQRPSYPHKESFLRGN